ncbi:MAG: hypothetical protein ACRC9Z_10355 [Weissella confusa]
MINRKQILIEWDKAGILNNKYTFQDVNDQFEYAAHNTPNDDEANKLVILAIRKAGQNGGTSSATVDNNLRKWINAGATTADKVGEYERQRTSQVNAGRYGQPLRQESSIELPSDDEIAAQSTQVANDLGYATIQEATKAEWDKILALRVARASKNPASTGRTATGQRVLQRF